MNQSNGDLTKCTYLCQRSFTNSLSLAFSWIWRYFYDILNKNKVIHFHIMGKRSESQNYFGERELLVLLLLSFLKPILVVGMIRRPTCPSITPTASTHGCKSPSCFRPLLSAFSLCLLSLKLACICLYLYVENTFDLFRVPLGFPIRQEQLFIPFVSMVIPF